MGIRWGDVLYMEHFDFADESDTGAVAVMVIIVIAWDDLDGEGAQRPWVPTGVVAGKADRGVS